MKYEQYQHLINLRAKMRDKRLHEIRLMSHYKKELYHEKQARTYALKNPFLNLNPDMLLTHDYIFGANRKRKFNDTYSDYFKRLADEMGSDHYIYEQIADRVEKCYKYWFFNYYPMNGVKDMKSILLCHNKFCSNCSRLIQSSRLKRFTSVFDNLQQDYDLYHLTLTVPNVSGVQLDETIDKILSCFSKLSRYFSRDAKIRGIDFEQYGFVGGVRCLECTIKEDLFHPHLHCILVMKKDLNFYKYNINPYSFDHKVLKNKFSDFEILIQKIWYLIINGERVNLKNVEDLPLGYSCIMDKIDGDSWHEAFKYVTKLTKEDNRSAVMSYAQFKYMYFALQRRRSLQGYGVLYNVAQQDEIDDSVLDDYWKVIGRLQLLEKPHFSSSTLDEVMDDVVHERYKFISKLSIQRYLNALAAEEKGEDL